MVYYYNTIIVKILFGKLSQKWIINKGITRIKRFLRLIGCPTPVSLGNVSAEWLLNNVVCWLMYLSLGVVKSRSMLIFCKDWIIMGRNSFVENRLFEYPI